MDAQSAIKNKPFGEQILLSKRAYVFYLEHVRVMLQNERVIFLSETQDDYDGIFNIPHNNTSMLLLGKGCSITDGAIRKLSSANVLLGFTGSHGTPSFYCSDFVFLSPKDEYGPTEYMQSWIKLWLNEERRLTLAKRFLRFRITQTEKSWRQNNFLTERAIIVSPQHQQDFEVAINHSRTTTDLLLAEAVWAKRLYKNLANGFQTHFSRTPGQSKQHDTATTNSALDHGNYLAYGYAAVVLNGLGISYALPVLHGKTRRGALVFDVADLFKDWLVMPIAFLAEHEHLSHKEVRGLIIKKAHETQLLDIVFDFIKSCCISP